MILDRLDVKREEIATGGTELADGTDRADALIPEPLKPATGTGEQKIMRILLLEDDAPTAVQLIKGLREHGHTVDWAENGADGLVLARGSVYDVMIVDRGMPVMDGVGFVREVRGEGISTPTIFVTAHHEIDQRVEGLKAGADDYLSKPISFAELFARIDAINRRSNPIQAATKLQVGDLTMDLLARKVWRSETEILLQPREFRLLEYLMKHAEQVVTRTMLLENVWEYHFDPQTNVIDVHISRLRSKIDKTFEKPMLHTIRGAGYSLRAPI